MELYDFLSLLKNSIINNDFEKIVSLYEQELDYPYYNIHVTSLIKYSVKNNNIKITDFLFTATGTNYHSAHSQVWFIIAAKNNCLEIFEYLCDKFNKSPQFSYIIFKIMPICIKNDNLILLKKVLEWGKLFCPHDDFYENIEKCMYISTQRNRIHTLKFLCDNYDNSSCEIFISIIEYALLLSHFRIAILLINVISTKCEPHEKLKFRCYGLFDSFSIYLYGLLRKCYDIDTIETQFVIPSDLSYNRMKNLVNKIEHKQIKNLLIKDIKLSLKTKDDSMEKNKMVNDLQYYVRKQMILYRRMYRS
jgi:hypothetical protein